MIKVGYDLENINFVEDLVRKKNTDIAKLSKELKLPATEYPMAKDIEETKTQKVEMMKLNIEKST